MKQNHEDVGKLVIRVSLGLMVLCHGVAKLLGGVGFIEQMLQGHGLPGFLAWGVLVGEVLGPLLLIAGFQARLGAWLIAINMLVAIGLVHMGEVFTMNGSGGWAIELQAMFLFTAIGLALTGPGRFGISGK